MFIKRVVVFLLCVHPLYDGSSIRTAMYSIESTTFTSNLQETERAKTAAAIDHFAFSWRFGKPFGFRSRVQSMGSSAKSGVSESIAMVLPNRSSSGHHALVNL
jgi:hypothetical protein